MGSNPREGRTRVAFYDLDGTLVTSNVVTRYAWFAKHHPRKAAAAWRYGKTLVGVPLWLLLDACSRRLFNVVFFRQYRGLREDWLRERAREMFEAEMRHKQFRFAKQRIALDKAAGYHAVMVSGGLDFALAPAAQYFGLDAVLANQLVFRGGVATGEVVPPLLAGKEKASALERFSAARGFDMREARAYSDSASDLPMLRAVGMPVATNPDTKLRRSARENGWKVLDLRYSATPLAARKAG